MSLSIADKLLETEHALEALVRASGETPPVVGDRPDIVSHLNYITDLLGTMVSKQTYDEIRQKVVSYGAVSEKIDMINALLESGEISGDVDMEPITITENGEYSLGAGRGYSQVTASVPNTYTEADEGKVVESGALVGQTALIVTERGSYDTKKNDLVVVNMTPNNAPGIVARSLSVIEDPDVTSVGEFAFYSYSTLQSVSFPACQTISNSAFIGCNSLVNAYFPACTTIKRYAFSGCGSLTNISFPSCITIEGNVFQNCSNLLEASFPSCVNILVSAFARCSSLVSAFFPSCETITDYAFISCYSLTNIYFPACTSIGSSAFANCSSLTEASFSACESIGAGAFAYCSSLTEASFPACKSIAFNAFNYCPSLTEASFPVCTSIEGGAFGYCYRLLSLYLANSSVCTLGNSTAFNSTPIGGYTNYTSGVYGSVFVPASLYDQYIVASNWSTISDRIASIPEE